MESKAFLAKARKNELMQLAEELGEIVTPNIKIFALAYLIINSKEYERNPEFVKRRVETIIDERKKRERKEEETESKRKEAERERVEYERKREREEIERIEAEKIRQFELEKMRIIKLIERRQKNIKSQQVEDNAFKSINVKYDTAKYELNVIKGNETEEKLLEATDCEVNVEVTDSKAVVPLDVTDSEVNEVTDSKDVVPITNFMEESFTLKDNNCDAKAEIDAHFVSMENECSQNDMLHQETEKVGVVNVVYDKRRSRDKFRRERSDDEEKRNERGRRTWRRKIEVCDMSEEDRSRGRRNYRDCDPRNRRERDDRSGYGNNFECHDGDGSGRMMSSSPLVHGMKSSNEIIKNGKRNHQRKRDSDVTQPTMMVFKQSYASQNYGIHDQGEVEKYHECKEEFEQITRYLDAVVINLEDDSDFDLKVLDEPFEEEKDCDWKAVDEPYEEEKPEEANAFYFSIRKEVKNWKRRRRKNIKDVGLAKPQKSGFDEE